MRCLITGINGVVGTNLANILSQNYAWDIIGLGSSVSSIHKKYYKADLTRKDEIDRVVSELKTCDIVVHCAAIIDLQCDPVDLVNTNVIGSLNALRLSKSIQAKQFIHISSIPVIGKILSLPITESHVCIPNTIYHLSKLQAEQVIDQTSGEAIHSVSLRIPSPVGLRMPERSILPILMGRALRNEEIKITGDKKRRQNFLDLRDLAQAIVHIAELLNVRGVYNIASETPVSNIDLAHAIVKKTNSKSQILNLTQENTGYYEDWNVDTAKAKTDFNFQAQYGINDSLDWIINRGTT